MIARHTPPVPATGRRLILALILALVGIEAVLLAGDFGIFGAADLRGWTYERAAFWPSLLRGGDPLYPGQGLMMFFTYGFVHTGPVHLLFNALALRSLGRLVLAEAGIVDFLLIYVVALLAGAGVYGLLAQTAQPVVGASGALFGLIAALAAWAARDRGGAQGLWLMLNVVTFLVALNLAMWWILGGGLAWQAHLGGFLAGWASAGRSRRDGRPGRRMS